MSRLRAWVEKQKQKRATRQSHAGAAAAVQALPPQQTRAAAVSAPLRADLTNEGGEVRPNLVMGSEFRFDVEAILKFFP